MKKGILLLMSVLTLLTSCSNKGKQEQAPVGDGLTGEIQLSGAFALYPMIVKWAEEFKKLHPQVKIDISGGGAGKGMTDALAGVVDLGMVSREIYPEEVGKGAFAIPVVKDAVVITINAKNPEIEAIRKTGLKQEVAQRLWNEEIKTWGELLGTGSNIPVHVFTRSDACGAAETFAKWLGKKQENLKATAVYGDPGVSGAVQKDRVGVGFNNIAYAYDQQKKVPFENLDIFPIDFNENGQVDPEENFYQNTDSLIQAIKDGRYRSPLARELYVVSKGKPAKPEVIEFLRYILSEGQQYAGETGYISLPAETLKTETERLNP
ncbi:PstS family phosphate ABC transporter substrate-binding protein [Parabacteroides sp. Marseille-P3160]|uniref:PstS family phosphate ABC transporter substrate-binding protein n=1 Tax=Parabacteroides sp. Marseille-P3160 TaxID=1917887 RepID=UPI0009BA9680|nr:extracellular solute-binding protein [Parabacteroides sp. Marseille-P3160]